MPRGGARPRAGRKFGIPNKATIERREQARIDVENAAAGTSGDVAEAATVPRKKLAKDILEEFMYLFAGMATFYKMASPSEAPNPNADERKFRDYAMLATQTARDLAPFQSPKLSAVAVGQVRKMVVVVKGGLPPRDTSSLPAIGAPAAEAE